MLLLLDLRGQQGDLVAEGEEPLDVRLFLAREAGGRLVHIRDRAGGQDQRPDRCFGETPDRVLEPLEHRVEPVVRGRFRRRDR